MNRILGTFGVIFFLFSCSVSTETDESNISGEKIIDNYIVSKGGVDRLMKVKTFKATLEARERNLIIENFRKKPDIYVDIMTYPNQTTKRILHRNTAVSISSDGNEPITGVALRDMQLDAKIFPAIYRKELGYEHIYVGEVIDNGKMLYKVEVLFENHQEQIEYYDQLTGLLFKTVYPSNLVIEYEEYQDIEGIKIVSSFKTITPMDTVHFLVKDVLLNPELDDFFVELLNGV